MQGCYESSSTPIGHSIQWSFGGGDFTPPHLGKNSMHHSTKRMELVNGVQLSVGFGDNTSMSLVVWSDVNEVGGSGIGK